MNSSVLVSNFCMCFLVFILGSGVSAVAKLAQTEETCSTHLTRLRLWHPGCVAQRVVTAACRGTCKSRSIPAWHHETEEIRMIRHCTCCKPLMRKYKLVTLSCPAWGGTKTLTVRAAMDCVCRPCSEGNPRAQKPYDY